MSLDTYDNLINEVIDWSHRTDLRLKVPVFISLAEDAMYSNNRCNLLVREMASTTIENTTTRYIDLPDRFESGRSFRVDVAGGKLRYKTPEQLVRQDYTGQPAFFTISGDQIEFDTVIDGYDIELNYFTKALPLSSGNQTNGILTNHSAVYLHGALAMLYTYVNDRENQAIYFDLFISAIKGANKADKKGRYGPAPAMAADGCAP